MTWHGQINRTIWEIGHQIKREPRNFRLRKEFLRTHFLQRYELDRSLHIPRDDRSFLFMQERRAPVCLLLHGENGTPAEMRDLGNYLYSRGLTLYCPRISRYDSKDRPVSWESWVTAAEGALTTVLQYSREAVIIGSSLGGTIALILDELHRIKALTLLAPAVYPKLGVRARLFSFARHIMPNLYFRLAGWDGETTKAMERARGRSTKVTTPMLALQARNDNVVSGKGLKFLERIVMNEKTEIVVLPDGTHTITRGNGREDVFDRVYSFLGKIRFIRSQSGPGSSSPSRRPSRASAGRGPRRSPQTGTRPASGEGGASPTGSDRDRPARPRRDRNALEREGSDRPQRERRPRRRGGRGRGPRDRGGEERKATEQAGMQSTADRSGAERAANEPARRERSYGDARGRSRSRRPRGRSQSDRIAADRPTDERPAQDPETPGADRTPEPTSPGRRVEEGQSGDPRDTRSPDDHREARPDRTQETEPRDESREARPDRTREDSTREERQTDQGDRDGSREDRSSRDD